MGNAQVAQLVEHATENRGVGGSIPPLGTTFPKLDLRNLYPSFPRLQRCRLFVER